MSATRDTDAANAAETERDADAGLSLPGFPSMTLAIAIEADAWHDAFTPTELDALTARVLAAAAEHLGLPKTLETEISVTFADDEAVREANAAWRGKDKPTNILSFPMVEIEPGDLPGPLAGDLLVAFETVTREAEQEEKSLADHLSHLLVHGFLHLLGHDHIEDEEAETMEAEEIAILARLQIADPYREP